MYFTNKKSNKDTLKVKILDNALKTSYHTTTGVKRSEKRRSKRGFIDCVIVYTNYLDLDCNIVFLKYIYIGYFI